MKIKVPELEFVESNKLSREECCERCACSTNCPELEIFKCPNSSEEIIGYLRFKQPPKKTRTFTWAEFLELWVKENPVFREVGSDAVGRISAINIDEKSFNLAASFWVSFKDIFELEYILEYTTDFKTWLRLEKEV